MGSLGSGTCPPLVVLALHLLLLLSQCLGWLSAAVEDSPRKIKANFEYDLRENDLFPIRRSKSLTSPWNLPQDALRISTVWLDDKPCVQISVSINVSGLPKFRGFDVELHELNSNRFHSISVLKKKSSKVWDLWQLQYYCWIVEPGQSVSVSLLTKPDYGISLLKMVDIPDYKKDKAPHFDCHHFAEEKRIVVSMPESQNAYARLCYQVHACEDLENSDKQLFNSSYNVSLSYDTLVPCLCIEVFYDQENSRRNQMCPFKDHPEPYYPDLMRVSAKKITFKNNTMKVHYKSPCRIKPHVSLCRKINGSCVTIPDAMPKEHEDDGDSSLKYLISSIDRDPNLCFQFTLTNHTYIKCPNSSDRVWNVDVKLNIFDVLLKISSKVPASFSAVICYQNQSSGICTIQSEVYNISTPSNEMQLSLPWVGLGRCIKVWRSDVNFAYEYLICSFDYSHKHIGLIALAMMLVTFILTLLIFLIFCRIWKIFTAPLWRRTILLVYSPDSLEYKTLICAFADFLQSILGCEVILDMWDMNNICKIGMLPWFYQKRELVTQRKGKVMIVWTTQTQAMYQQWRNRQLNSFVWRDPANLFGAAMSCLNKDLVAEQETGKLKEYAIVYFEGLCDRKDIPKALKKISRYRLFKDLYRLVSRLQDTTCLSPPCLIKAAAKYLMKKLIRSEKSQGLQYHVEICKQRLCQEMGVEKIKMESTAL